MTTAERSLLTRKTIIKIISFGFFHATLALNYISTEGVAHLDFININISDGIILLNTNVFIPK